MALDPKTKETVREEALRLSKEFAELDGRRPRVLLIEMENDLESDREERKLATLPSSTSGWASMTSNTRSAPATAERIVFTCWEIWVMGWLTCRVYCKKADRPPRSPLRMASRPPTQQVTA